MQNLENPHFTASDLNKTLYLPAVLKEYPGGWRIEYWVTDPQTHILKRQQIRSQRIAKRFKTKREAKIYMATLTQNINSRLAGGWNPLFQEEDSRLYHPLNAILDIFLAEKTKELRVNTMRSYRSFVTLLTEWMNNQSLNIMCGRFNKLMAVRYMDYIYNTRNVSARTYNNQVKLGRLVFNWLLEKCYIKTNPFEQIKPKAKAEKIRILIPKEERAHIVEYLTKKESNFLIVCQLVYNSLIRPNEIRQIKIGDINLEEHFITIPKQNAKNNHARLATLSPELEELIVRMNIDKYPKDYYLFGEQLTPNKIGCGSSRFSKEWIKLRNALKLPKEMQLYSLRDTGITSMLKAGIDDLTVMQHADHSSLEMTTIYAKHHDPNLVNTMYNNTPKF